MSYSIRRAWQRLKWNKWISILMIIEMILGMSVLVYAMNMYSSLVKEERRRANQSRDLCLEISGFNEKMLSETVALTIQDYEKIQKISSGKTFFYIALPEFYVANDKNYEFTMILADYDKLGLKKGYCYWGSNKESIEDIFTISEMVPRKMPTRINEQSWKTEVENIELKNCVIVPVEYMEQIEQKIEPAYIHMEWNSKELENKDQMLKNIEEYLNKMHGEVYSYRIYSPEIDLKNNGYKVKQSIRVIMQAGILFLIAFLGGMISIFELLFNHRKKAYGISLACGADYRTVFYEMFAEVALLNGIGMFIGIGIGYIVTYFVDMGIMIGYIKVEGSIVSFIASISVYLLITIIVSGKSYIKIKQRKVIELLNGD